MSSALPGKNREEPQALSKMEKLNNLEAEYDNPASVESRAEGISSKTYKEFGLGRRMQSKFGNHLNEHEIFDNFCYHNTNTAI